MSYEAVIRRQTFARSPGAQELHVKTVEYGARCGHQHADVRDAAICANHLASTVGLHLYESCIVWDSNHPEGTLSALDNALLADLVERYRKAASHG